jgi:hypothetical protein
MSPASGSPRWRIAIASLAGLAAFACTDYPDAYTAYLVLPSDERAAAITEYPPEQQVELYLWDLRVKHPPAPGLADAVARNGDRVLPILVRRIATEESERDRVDLLYVVLRIQSLGIVDVARDPEIMRTLAASVASIDDPDLRLQANDILVGIRTAP